MGRVTVHIWSVSWRNGRPRFNPGPKLRGLGYKGEDLQHPDKRWYTLDEAVQWAEQRKQDAAARRLARAEGKRIARVRSTGGPTLDDLFSDAQWFGSPKFTGGGKVGKRTEKPLAPDSIRDYRHNGRKLCDFDPDGKGRLGGEHPGALTVTHAQNIYEKLWERDGLHVANHVAATASAAWSWARQRGKCGVAVNPWLDLDKTTSPARVVVYEDFELRAWIAACDLALPEGKGRHPAARLVARPELGDGIVLGLFTGQRQKDRLALLDNGRDDKGRRSFRQSKTGAIVAVPETDELRGRLDASAARRKAAALINKHVILDEARGRPFKADHYRHLLAARREFAVHGVVRIDGVLQSGEGFDATLERGNVEWVLRPCPSLAGKQDRDLRDTAVTWLGRAGATVMEIAAITGHGLASIHSILKHYLALHPEMADAAIGKLKIWIEQQGIAV